MAKNEWAACDAAAEEGADAAYRMEEAARGVAVVGRNHDSAHHVAVAAAAPDAVTGARSGLEGRNDADSSRSALDSLEAVMLLGDHKNDEGMEERLALDDCNVWVAHCGRGGHSSAMVHHSDVVLEAPSNVLGEDLQAPEAGSWADTAAPSAYSKERSRAKHDETHEASLSQRLEPGETEPLMVAPLRVCYFGSCKATSRPPREVGIPIWLSKALTYPILYH